MTRQHQSKYYASEGLRGLQAQIDELWGVVEGLESEGSAALTPLESDPHDDAAHAVTAEVADTLKPDPRVAAVTPTI